MSDLDDKLEALLSRYEIREFGLPAMGDLRTTNERVAGHIKQAFIEAGWLSPEGSQDVQDKLNAYAQLHEAVTKYVMSGGPPDFIVLSQSDWVLNAKLAGWQPIPAGAKKAAGLK